MSEVKLVRLDESHESPLAELLTDPRVGETYLVPDFSDAESLAKTVRRIIEISHEPERYARGILADGELVGLINDVGIDGSSIELGYAILPRFQNRGCATDAVKAALKELRELGFTRVRAGAFETNLASLRVMEKSGMSRISFTEELEYRGVKHLCIYYEIEI